MKIYKKIIVRKKIYFYSPKKVSENIEKRKRILANFTSFSFECCVFFEAKFMRKKRLTKKNNEKIYSPWDYDYCIYFGQFY